MAKTTHLRIFLALILALAVVWLGSSIARAQGHTPERSLDGVWEFIDESSFTPAGQRLIIPNVYQTASVDIDRLSMLLAPAPELRQTRHGVILHLPLANGKFQRFQIFSAPIMAPELAVRYPQIRTYAGQGIDDPTATVRLDLTPHGFHAQILSSHGVIYIDPYSRNDTKHYVVYDRQNYTRTQVYEELGPLPNPEAENPIGAAAPLAPAAPLAHGTQLRTYRVVIAATGEYTQYHGGAVADGMAAIVTALNRVNGIYEREVAVTMNLVANNDLVVYTNASTDPYTNNNGAIMLYQNQNNLDSVIGNANYDIGHVFSTGGGGIAGLGVVCLNNSKAHGVTGLSQPIGDAFYVDYVAHEMGHQYDANHTFASSAGSCSGNANSSTAYEPGSGSTIMAYAGICAADDLQPHSDDYFHGVSLDEIVNFITSGTGKNCGVATATGNTPPTVDAGPGGYSLPKNTPFRLTGSGSDANAEDSLTFDWEEFDLGPLGPPNNGAPPFFRSFNPVAAPSRVFPQISDIVNNTESIGEELPSDSRTLNFRLTVRDNRAGGGGVAFDTMSINVTTSAGPFKVTAPNTAVTWDPGSSQTVSWDVANTTAPPVSCSQVNILLSTDGGYTYPITLLSNTANDGSQAVTVPNASTAAARVQVTCADGRFFDISDVNFTISGTAPAAPADLSISDDGFGNAVLEWTHLGANSDYEVWRDLSPYFNPSLGEGSLADTLPATAGVMTFTDFGYIGDFDFNHFWLVRGKAGASVSAPSNRVGEFDFELIAP